MRMRHHGQCLTLGHEPVDDFARIHAGFEQFQSHAPADRPLLLGDVDLPESSFTDLFHQAIHADDFPGSIGCERANGRLLLMMLQGGVGCDPCCGLELFSDNRHGSRHLVEQVVGPIVGRQQTIDSASKVDIGTAHLIQVCGTFLRAWMIQSPEKDLLFQCHSHGGTLPRMGL